MPTITHIVQFAYKKTVNDEDKREIAARFLNLQHECKLAGGRGYRYLTVAGGKNNSPEKFSKGLEHAFVVKFEGQDAYENRMYYLDEDPGHLAFKAFIQDKIAAAVVLDFEDGVF